MAISPMVGGADFSAGAGGDVGSLDAFVGKNGHSEMAMAGANRCGIGGGASFGGGAVMFQEEVASSTASDWSGGVGGGDSGRGFCATLHRCV